MRGPSVLVEVDFYYFFEGCVFLNRIKSRIVDTVECKSQTCLFAQWDLDNLLAYSLISSTLILLHKILCVARHFA